MSKPQVALYWAAGCGGCEIAVLDIGERLLDLAAAVDIVFWPCAMDVKYADVEAMEDGEIDLCLFNGAIRNTENATMARLLRRKAKVLVAYGSCAHEGCVIGLANLHSREKILRDSYLECPSVENPRGVLPRVSCEMEGHSLELPELKEALLTLDQVVEVDYYVPGCPPVADQTWAVLTAFLEGKLPPAGSVVGAGTKIVCEECPLEKADKRIRKFHRPHEVIPEPGKCLLDQGVFCAGIGTRAGCGALCPSVGMPCRGCYGPPPGVRDQGAGLIGAVGSILDARDPREIREILEGIPCPTGLFYRFSLAHSILRRKSEDVHTDQH